MNAKKARELTNARYGLVQKISEEQEKILSTTLRRIEDAATSGQELIYLEISEYDPVHGYVTDELKKLGFKIYAGAAYKEYICW